MVMKIFLYDADSTADIVLLPFIYVVIVIITAHCSMILNGNIFQTAPSSEFRTGSSLEKYVLSQLTNSELDLVWNSKLDLVWNSEVGSVWN